MERGVPRVERGVWPMAPGVLRARREIPSGGCGVGPADAGEGTPRTPSSGARPCQWPVRRSVRRRTAHAPTRRRASGTGQGLRAAPEGRRVVATGGAQAQPERNPWARSSHLISPRRGEGVLSSSVLPVPPLPLRGRSHADAESTGCASAGSAPLRSTRGYTPWPLRGREWCNRPVRMSVRRRRAHALTRRRVRGTGRGHPDRPYAPGLGTCCAILIVCGTAERKSSKGGS